eukprot:15453160-Alexandrium_andersonii.AAC.1
MRVERLPARLRLLARAAPGRRVLRALPGARAAPARPCSAHLVRFAAHAPWAGAEGSTARHSPAASRPPPAATVSAHRLRMRAPRAYN